MHLWERLHLSRLRQHGFDDVAQFDLCSSLCAGAPINEDMPRSMAACTRPRLAAPCSCWVRKASRRGDACAWYVRLMPGGA